ncbi:MAG: type II toxin-antitoxin system PemK/MazF family toxin [Enterobacterales bacterium]|nr:type II toxin-antitoxin system PemK/MazF family toxin [Enterobacterales bacterium]
MSGDFRPCLVLSPKAFNRLGVTLIAPISQGGDFGKSTRLRHELNGVRN